MALVPVRDERVMHDSIGASEATEGHAPRLVPICNIDDKWSRVREQLRGM